MGVFLLDVVNELVEFAVGDFAVLLVEQFMDGVEEEGSCFLGLFFGGDEEAIDVSELREVSLNLVFEVALESVAFWCWDGVDFVDDEEDGFMESGGEVDEVEFLSLDLVIFLGVVVVWWFEDDGGDGGVGEVLGCVLGREFFEFIVDSGFFSHAGGVDKVEFWEVEFELCCVVEVCVDGFGDGFACGAGER